MTKPPTSLADEDALHLLNAYLDGELSASAALAVEQRMSADPALKVEYDRLQALSRSISMHVRKDQASHAFRQSIENMTLPANAARHKKSVAAAKFDLAQLAAAILIGMCVASGTTYFVLRPASPANMIDAMVGAHEKALKSSAPFDVASSDRHTVKPWFATKLGLSPTVVDLAAAGFPLEGGRVDVVSGLSVPTLVYRRREHFISVVAIPTPGGRDTAELAVRATRDGFTVLEWQGVDFKYSAVSDVADTDLQDFVTRWRAEARPK